MRFQIIFYDTDNKTRTTIYVPTKEEVERLLTFLDYGSFGTLTIFENVLISGQNEWVNVTEEFFVALV